MDVFKVACLVTILCIQPVWTEEIEGKVHFSWLPKLFIIQDTQVFGRTWFLVLVRYVHLNTQERFTMQDGLIPFHINYRIT